MPAAAPERFTLAEAARANLETGVLLLCKEALVNAINDRRLDRGHLHVLASIATHMNRKTGKAWPGRVTIAESLGVTPKSVSNRLRELRDFGYLIAEKEPVAEANNRRLTVYTFGKIDHETIRREITKFIDNVRSGNAAAKVPPQRELESPAPAGISRPEGSPKVPPQREPGSPKVPPQREPKSRPSGDSNSKKELNEKKKKKEEEGADAPPSPAGGINAYAIDTRSDLDPGSVADTPDAWWANGFIEVAEKFRAQLERDFPHVDLMSGLAIASGEALPDETGSALTRRIQRRFGYLNNDQIQRIKRAEAARGNRAAGPSAAGQPTRRERFRAMVDNAEKLTYRERLQKEDDERSERLQKRIEANLAKKHEQQAANPEMTEAGFIRWREEEAEKRRKQSL